MGKGGSWEPTFIPSQSNFKSKNKIPRRKNQDYFFQAEEF